MKFNSPSAPTRPVRLWSKGDGMGEKPFTAGDVLCPGCKARTFVQDQPWKLVCVSCYLERNPGKRRTPEPVLVAPAGIEPDMLRRLVQLCHPDRHGNSEAANTATRWLLALRKGADHA
jgi:hypothetical protein